MFFTLIFGDNFFIINFSKFSQEVLAHKVVFFFSLFSKKPDFYNHFNTLFKGKSLEAAKGSPELSAQAQSFKGMLNIWTENLDDPGTLTVQTLRFAKLHKARGVTADQIQV